MGGLNGSGPPESDIRQKTGGGNVHRKRSDRVRIARRREASSVRRGHDCGQGFRFLAMQDRRRKHVVQGHRSKRLSNLGIPRCLLYQSAPNLKARCPGTSVM